MKKVILFSFFVSILYSCGVSRVYTPANYGVTKKYMAKPIYNNKNVSANYVSLSISNGKHPHKDVEKVDTKFVSSLNIHQSKSFKKYNFYYGIGLNYGSFKFKNSLDNSIQENETQSFYTINPKIGISLKKSKSNFDFHIIGLELNYNYENGAYHNKLSEIIPSNSIRVVNEKSLFSFNLFSELLFKLNKDNTIGFGLFAGEIIGLNETKYNIENNEGKGFGGLTFSYRYKKTTFSFVTESAIRNIQSLSYGISYQF